ncbi:hypothetical protein BS78_09G129600 [Paspalum vaginatum]|nr:hypothetical protein BS78_09G129600 [Paspalum vaginatum]
MLAPLPQQTPQNAGHRRGHVSASTPSACSRPNSTATATKLHGASAHQLVYQPRSNEQNLPSKRKYGVLTSKRGANPCPEESHSTAIQGTREKRTNRLAECLDSSGRRAIIEE